jgi:hypothetical protein
MKMYYRLCEGAGAPPAFAIPSQPNRYEAGCAHPEREVVSHQTPLPAQTLTLIR